MWLTLVSKNCDIKMDEQEFQFDLIVLPVTEYDVILGTDCLSAIMLFLNVSTRNWHLMIKVAQFILSVGIKMNRFHILLITYVVLLIINVS